MNENGELSDEQLEMVAKHGSGPYIRKKAALLLAERRGALDDLEAQAVSG